MMQKIVPHLWFEHEALVAAQWYVSLFENSNILNVITIPDTPSGDAELVDFQLADIKFSAMSAGPYFRLNQSISLMVACSTVEEVDRLYKSLSAGGTELMPLGEYPFSKRYAWIQDKYGLSWQLMHTDATEGVQRIRPSLLFSDNVCGRAEEAINFYTSVFQDSKKGFVSHYKAGEAMDPRANINYGEVELLGSQLIAMDHALGGDSIFSEALSFIVQCENQDEIDYYWDKLSYVPEAEECGWLKDKYGLSWQIEPTRIKDVLIHGTKEEVRRVTEAILKMKKINLAALDKARKGE